MQEHPNSGYVIPLNEIITLCKPQLKSEQLAALEELGEAEGDEAREILNPILQQQGMPTVESVFALADEDTSEDLEKQTLYGCFAESDLYVRQNTPAHTRLLRAGLAPKQAHWSIFG